MIKENVSLDELMYRSSIMKVDFDDDDDDDQIYNLAYTLEITNSHIVSL